MSKRLIKSWPVLWWIAIAALVVLHFVHLQADFPNFSPWMDYSKYTDEGWYANAAIRHALFGHWRVPGGFNPAVAVPVWPVLVRVAFALGGVNLITARSLELVIFTGDLLLSYALLRRAASRVVALAAVTFLAASAFLWAFSRLAILEPLEIFFLLLSWLLVFRASGSRQRTALLLGAGLSLAFATLTKATAIFVAPSTLYLVGQTGRSGLALGVRQALRRALLDLAPVAAGALAPAAAYYFLLVRPRYVVDFHYFFAVNRWAQPTTLSGWFWDYWYALHGTLWIDPPLCCLALVLLPAMLLLHRRGRVPPGDSAACSEAHSLVWACLLASAGAILFMGWHNSPQPRYYEVVAFPLVFVTVLGAGEVCRSRLRVVRLLGLAAWLLFALITGRNVRGSIYFARHPEYTLLSAAKGITAYVDEHPNGNRLLLSISGDQITLITHLPAMCDDFGTTDLPYRMRKYRPGWYAGWNELDPGTLEDLHTQYSLEQVAQFRAFDDQDRDELILYKLHPLPAALRSYDAATEARVNRGKE